MRELSPECLGGHCTRGGGGGVRVDRQHSDNVTQEVRAVIYRQNTMQLIVYSLDTCVINPLHTYQFSSHRKLHCTRPRELEILMQESKCNNVLAIGITGITLCALMECTFSV